jgi:nucleoside-diphosphate-sugar epimerase
MEIFGSLPKSDLNDLSNTFWSDHHELSNVNFLVVGANGFLGNWVSTYLIYLQSREILTGTVTLVVRKSESIANLASIKNTSSRTIVEIEKMDEKSFLHLNPNYRTVVIYAATKTSLFGKESTINKQDSVELPERIVQLVPNLHTTFIHLSSGGIYSRTARSLTAIPRDYQVQHSSTDSYVQEKIALEEWTKSKYESNSFLIRNPRLFTFYGPGLQLDRHFAIGDFINCGRNQMPIKLTGNPSNLRSYLYPTDAIHQILNQALLAEPKHKQIGSCRSMSLHHFASVIAQEYNVELEICDLSQNNLDNYVPLDVPIAFEKDFVAGIRTWKRWIEEGYS